MTEPSCLNCGVFLPGDRRKFCSDKCKKAYWGKQDYASNKELRKRQMRERYGRVKEQKTSDTLGKILNLSQSLDDSPLSLLLLPNNDALRLHNRRKHFEMHGIPTVTTQTYFFTVSKCIECDLFLDVQLPKRYHTKDDSFKMGIKQRYRSLNQLQRLHEVLMEKKKIHEAGLVNEVMLDILKTNNRT